MARVILDRWWPVTYDFGLIKAEVETLQPAVRAMYGQSGLEITITPVSKSLEGCFKLLEPLSPTPTKELYLSTRFGWTAFFRNSTRGSDPFLPMSRLSKKLDKTAMRICISPPEATYPAVIWEVYDTPEAGGSGKLGYRRSIAASNDGGRWVFEQSGEPFPFEDTARYTARLKRDRFTSDMLGAYLSEFGIPAIADEAFDLGGVCKGFMLSRPAHPHIATYTLEQVTSARGGNDRSD